MLSGLSKNSMTKKEKISLSVLMPCYNEVTVVGRAIESILNQSFPNFEFIIVDDGSTDGTYELCQKYAKEDKRIKLFQFEENSGSCTKPLNFAIQKSSASFIARMDADDVSYPSRFKQQYDFLKTHPEVDIIGTAINLIDKDNNNSLGIIYYPEFHENIIKRKYWKPFLAHPTVMLRKTVYDAFGGYNPQLIRAQDSELWLKASNSFRFHNLQEVLLDYYRPSTPKAFTDASTFKNLLSIKYQGMKRNGDLLKYWPILFFQIVNFVIQKIRMLFSGAK